MTRMVRLWTLVAMPLPLCALHHLGRMVLLVKVSSTKVQQGQLTCSAGNMWDALSCFKRTVRYASLVAYPCLASTGV